MIDVSGQEMSLTANAERVCADLVSRGARATSGYRHLTRQAHAMAVNVCKITYAPDDHLQQTPILHRDFIGRTYVHGQELQNLIDEHPEWDTVDEVTTQLVHFLTDHPDIAKKISHHCTCLCECFDLDPPSVNEAVKARIAEYEREGVIVKVLWKEAGLDKCHIEVALLHDIKVNENPPPQAA